MNLRLNLLPDAEPLGEADLKEAEAEGWSELVVALYGEKYDCEDLYACDGCDEWHVSSDDLNEDGYCENCAQEAREAAEYRRSVRSDYHAGVL